MGLFGKKQPAPPGPKKAAVKPMYKPAAAKTAKKPAAKAKPPFSFGAGTAKKATPAKNPAGTASKSKYTITKTAGTVKKSKPTTFKTVNFGAKKPAAPKPAGVRPMYGSARPSGVEPTKPAVYDKETVGVLGLGSIFAGTFLLTLAALPVATESALELVGVGYSAYFAYNWFVNPESRDEFDKTMTKIDDKTGINLKRVVAVTGELVVNTSKKLAEAAETSASEASASKTSAAEATAAETSAAETSAKAAEAEAKEEKAAAAATAEKADELAAEAKKSFKEAVKEAVKEAEQ